VKSSVVLLYREVTDVKVYPSNMESYKTECYVLHSKYNKKVYCYGSTIWKDNPSLDEDDKFLINNGFLYKVLMTKIRRWK
jgi:hypothetical protein